MNPGDDEPTLAGARSQSPAWNNSSPYGEQQSPAWNNQPVYVSNQSPRGGNQTPYNGGSQPPDGGKNRNNRPLLIALISMFVLLVVLFSTGIYAYTHSGQANQGRGGNGNQQPTTAPSVGNQPTVNTTATASTQAGATATTGAQAGANATATASTQADANATATVGAQAQMGQFNGTWLDRKSVV